MIIQNLPKTVSVFQLSYFIIFPYTTVPLYIFEPRYIEMINDRMKTNSMIGLIQPTNNDDSSIPGLHKIGCLGKITNFKDTSDGRYMIDLNGITRFEVIKEIKSSKPYRICETSYNSFELDLNPEKKKLKFSDLESIFKNLKLLFEKRGYIINWKSLEKQNLNETLNALAMASPFSLEEKQILLESKNLDAIILNSLKDKGAGFASDTNTVTFIDHEQRQVHFELKSKTAVANDIMNEILNKIDA